MKIIKINAVWCGGCLVSKKIWNDIEKEYPNIEYISYDYDLDEEEVDKYNIGDVLPVVIIENNGKEIKRIIGEKSKEEIVDIIKELV